MKVPRNWWQGCDAGELNAGTTAAIDFSKSNQRYFQILLDADKDETEDKDNLLVFFYSIRCDAALLYADKTHC